jgi:hypothetical protein
MATTTIQSRFKIRRKASAFVNGELLAGELGINTANGSLYGSVDGTSVVLLVDVDGTSASAVSELTDVTLTALGDNEVLQYDTATSKWENRTLAELGIDASDIVSLTAFITSHSDVASNTAARHSHANKTALDAITDAGSGAIITSGERSSIGTAIQSSEKGAANGVATLGGDSKIPTSQIPDAVLGQLEYQGTWNADTNTPTLASATGTKGHYYKVSVAGSTAIDGETDWKVGDWIVYNGTAWDKIDNTESVPSVFGRSGAVAAQAGDYSAAQVTNAPAGGISATTVQAAIDELDADKAPVSHNHSASNITSGDMASARMATNVAAAMAASPDTIIFDAGSI